MGVTIFMLLSISFLHTIVLEIIREIEYTKQNRVFQILLNCQRSATPNRKKMKTAVLHFQKPTSILVFSQFLYSAKDISFKEEFPKNMLFKSAAKQNFAPIATDCMLRDKKNSKKRNIFPILRIATLQSTSDTNLYLANYIDKLNPCEIVNFEKCGTFY